MLGAFDGRLCLCDWENGKHRDLVGRKIQQGLKAHFEEGKNEMLAKAERQLDEYFAKKRTTFDLPLLFVGTEFQKTVWNALLTIPYGKTISYGDLAKQIGMPTAVRAVANANSMNALSIIAPCHRVIGSNHTLTGYAGGLAAKQMLLELESGQDTLKVR